MIDRFVAASGRLLFGLAVVTVGVLLTLDNLDLLEAEPILRWFPVLLVLAGLAKLSGVGVACRNVGLGLVLVVVGGWLLLNTLDVVPEAFDLWPLILILAGGYVAFTAFSGPRASMDDVDSRFSALAVMGGVVRKNTSQNFTGGQASAFMGGCEIDLRAARIEGEVAVVEAFAMWGGVELRVPEDWRVTGRVFPLMGAFEDKTKPPAEPRGHLIVRGMVLMGGVEVSN